MSSEITPQQADCEGRSRRVPVTLIRNGADLENIGWGRLVASAVPIHTVDEPTDKAALPVIKGEWPRLKTHILPNIARIARGTIHFEDGSRFDFRRVVPYKPKHGISVDFMTPLGTETDGFNLYVALKLAEAGIASRIIGTNKAPGKGLAHDALAALVILHEDDEQQRRNPYYEPGRSVNYGYSMGLMKAFALHGQAALLNRTIDFGIGVDPGPANKIKYTPREALHFGLWMARLGVEASQIILESWQDTSLPQTVARAKNLLPTVSLRPTAAWNTVRKLHTIAGGEVSSYLHEVPDDTAMVLHFFKGNRRYNQADAYAAALGNHPYVHFVHEPGSHLAGARFRALDALVNKFAIGLELLEAGTKPGEICEALTYPLRDAA